MKNAIPGSARNWIAAKAVNDPILTQQNENQTIMKTTITLCISVLVAFLGALLAEQAHGQIYVTMTNGGGIGEYDATTGATINATLVSGVYHPVGITVSGGNLFVAFDQLGTVGEFNATTGATVNAPLVSGLNDYPWGVAVSGGNLFVGRNRGGIGKYDATTGATVNASFISGYGTAFIAVSGGNLFVTNSLGTIGEYDAATGATVNAALVSGLNSPVGIAVSGGNLYVANSGDGTIGEYNATTGGTINASLVSGLNYPWGIAVAEAILPQSISDLISIINSQSTLNGGQQKSFVAKLQAAQSSIASNKSNAACGQLGAFINDVNASQRTGGLDQTTANILINFVITLKQSLGCSP